jgi:hypothetical protein
MTGRGMLLPENLTGSIPADEAEARLYPLRITTVKHETL